MRHRAHIVNETFSTCNLCAYVNSRLLLKSERYRCTGGTRSIVYIIFFTKHTWADSTADAAAAPLRNGCESSYSRREITRNRTAWMARPHVQRWTRRIKIIASQGVTRARVCVCVSSCKCILRMRRDYQLMRIYEFNTRVLTIRRSEHIRFNLSILYGCNGSITCK